MIRDVTDLTVYSESLWLLRKLYELLRKLPKSEYDSVVQCKKCGKSIPANVAEGFAKRSSELEFKRYLKIAIGSSDELISHLRTIAIAVPRLFREAKELAEEYKVLSKRINSLHTNWKSGKFWLSDNPVHWVSSEFSEKIVVPVTTYIEDILHKDKI